jgi:hypothetical protein
VVLRVLARFPLLATAAVASLMASAAGAAGAAPTGIALPQVPLPVPQLTPPPVSLPPIPVAGPSPTSLPDPAGSAGVVSDVGAGSAAVGPPADVSDAPALSERTGSAGRAPIPGDGQPGTGPGGSSLEARSVPAADAPSERHAGLALRRILGQLGGCVATLPADERRVLLLRANTGGSQPRSRARVAQLLGMSVATVRSAEDRGVGDLRHASQTGSCNAGSGLAAPPAFLTLRASPTSRLAPESGWPTAAPGPRLGAVGSAGFQAAAPPVGPATASRVAGHPEPPGTAEGRLLPKWLGLGLIGLLALLFSAFLVFEFLEATGRLQGWRYRRSRQRGIGASPAVVRSARAPQSNDQVAPGQGADGAAGARAGAESSRHRSDQPARRRHAVRGPLRSVRERRPGA